MNITKYCEFLLDKKHSEKKNKDYYCITIRFKDYSFPLIFISESQYKKMLDSLN